MRRPYKFVYYVSESYDVRIGNMLWWCRGKWTRDVPVGAGCVNTKAVRTFDRAMKAARKIKAQGGQPVIIQRKLGAKGWEREWRF